MVLYKGLRWRADVLLSWDSKLQTPSWKTYSVHLTGWLPRTVQMKNILVQMNKCSKKNFKICISAMNYSIKQSEILLLHSRPGKRGKYTCYFCYATNAKMANLTIIYQKIFIFLWKIFSTEVHMYTKCTTSYNVLVPILKLFY